MAVTLAERQTNGPDRVRRRRLKLMEKFVIEGGVPLSGTMVPAGNKNGALPILASSVLTEDEVIVRNVPRIRDVEAMLEILRAIGVEVAWRGPNERRAVRRRRARRGDRPRARRADPRLLPARRAAARALSPRRDAAAGRRRDRPPPPGPAPRRLPRDGRDAPSAGGEIVLTAPRGLRPTDVFMDEPSVMATENALMAAALTPGHDRDRQRRLRAPRAGPRAHAREDGRRHPGDRLEPDHRQRRRAPARLRARRRPRPHRDRQLHGARRRHRRRTAHQGHRARRPAHDPARLRTRSACAPSCRATT